METKITCSAAQYKDIELVERAARLTENDRSSVIREEEPTDTASLFTSELCYWNRELEVRRQLIKDEFKLSDQQQTFTLM